MWAVPRVRVTAANKKTTAKKANQYGVTSTPSATEPAKTRTNVAGFHPLMFRTPVLNDPGAGLRSQVRATAHKQPNLKTETMALLPGSPAIDAVQACPPPKTDQRNVKRQSPCDIGAYERVPDK
jgi:hypothetical protein